MAAVRIV